MAKTSTSEVLRLVQAAIEREKVFIAGCKAGEQRDNPQVVGALRHAEGRLDALEAVELALRGNLVFLKIIAGVG